MRIVQLTTDSREHFADYSNPSPCFGSAPESLLQGFSMIPEVEVHVVSCVQQPVKSPEKIADNIFCHSLLVPKSGWLRTGYQGCIRAVRKKLREIAPDIVHGQGTERDCAISAVFSGFPNVVTIHGNMRAHFLHEESRNFFFAFATLLETVSVRRTNGLIAISSYTREIFSSSAKNIWLLPNCTSISFFEGSKTQKNTRRILVVGRVHPLKNQLGLLEALNPQLFDRQFSIAIVGEGDLNSEYFRSLKSSAQAAGNVEFLGFLNREQLITELSRSTMLVLPTLEDNCPMVVLEAQAMGIPVAASRVGGIPDLIEDKVTGYLFDPTDSTSMRTVITDAMANPHQLAAVGMAGREHAMRTYHPEVIAKRHIEIYQDVLSNVRPRNLKAKGLL